MDNYDGDDERPFQDGVFRLQYTHSSSADFNASRLGREAGNPLEILNVTPADRHDSPPELLDLSPTGFIDINSQDVVLSTGKAADSGDGCLLRFYHTTGRPVAARFPFPGLRFDKPNHVNGMEIDQEAQV